MVESSACFCPLCFCNVDPVGFAGDRQPYRQQLKTTAFLGSVEARLADCVCVGSLLVTFMLFVVVYVSCQCAGDGW